MKIRVVDYKKGEINIPLIYFFVLTISMLFGFLIVKLGLLPDMKCQFKSYTGYPCPTCGTTRLVLSLYNLDIVSAFKYNPFMFLFGVFLGLWSLTGFLPVFFKKKLVVSVSERERKVIVLVLIALFLLNWIYLIAMGI